MASVLEVQKPEQPELANHDSTILGNIFFNTLKTYLEILFRF